MAVTFVMGTGHETSVPWPAHAAGSWAFLFVEHDAGTIPTPTNCTIINNFPISQSASCHLSGFMIKATSGAMPNLAISGGTDHQWGTIIVANGADGTDPIAALAVYAYAGSNTAWNVPGVETEEDGCGVIHIIGAGLDSAGPIASSWANTSLTAVTEEYDAGTLTGDGGVITIATGQKATAGPVAMGTVTLTSTFGASATLAIRPPQVSSAADTKRAYTKAQYLGRAC